MGIAGLAFFKTEGHAPVCPDGHGPQALHLAFEGVQVKAGKIHIFRLAGTRKNEQDVFDFFQLVGTDAFGLALFEQPFQPLVSETPDHDAG